MSQRFNYYEDEIDGAEDYEEVGLNLAIGNYGQAGIYEDGSQSAVNLRHLFNSIDHNCMVGMQWQGSVMRLCWPFNSKSPNRSRLIRSQTSSNAYAKLSFARPFWLCVNGHPLM